MQWLNDPTDPRVILALKRRCTICGAKPDQPCTWQPPLNRLIHQDRAERGEVAP